MATAPASVVTPPTRSEFHDAVSRVAGMQGSTRSTFNNGVSLHRMPESVSFTSIKKILGACDGQERRLFLGTIDGTMVISVNFNHELPTSSTSNARSKKKRGRDPHEEAAQQTVERVKRGLSEEAGLNDDLLETARFAVYRLLTAVKGAQGESAIESYGLSFKSPEGARGANGSLGPTASSRPRLILSARLAPGVAIPVKALLDSLGGKCTQDGMLTVQDSSTLANGFNLPLSEQAQTAVSHGQKAISLFATVSQ